MVKVVEKADLCDLNELLPTARVSPLRKPLQRLSGKVLILLMCMYVGSTIACMQTMTTRLCLPNTQAWQEAVYVKASAFLIDYTVPHVVAAAVAADSLPTAVHAGVPPAMAAAALFAAALFAVAMLWLQLLCLSLQLCLCYYAMPAAALAAMSVELAWHKEEIVCSSPCT